MEQTLIDYLTNATWQIPLLAGGAWFFIRIGKFGPRTQHCIWLVVLALAVGLPLRGVRLGPPPVTNAACIHCGMDSAPPNGREVLPRAAIITQFVVADPRLTNEFFTLPRPTLRLSPVETHWLIGIYLAIFFFGLYRILASWRRTRQLVLEADPTTLPLQWNAIFQDSGRRLGARLPQLRKSADVSSPVIVGVMHPVLLLPEDFDEHSRNEVEAALFHELAHVRRHDYLGNLLCQLAALPVAWHPLTYGVQQRIRRTREMICDEIAAQAMQSEIGYAKCLLAMAGRTLGPREFADATQAIGLFGDNILEERIMRLMQEKNTSTMQEKLARIAIGAIAMIIAVAMAAFFHVTPTLAQSSGTAVTTPAPPAPSATPAPDMAAAPALSASPDSVTSAPPHPPVPPAPDSAEAPVVPSAPPVKAASGESAVPVAPVAPIAPIRPVAPMPADAPPPSQKNKAVHRHPKNAKNESFVVDSNGAHALTPEEQAQLQKDMAAMDAQIAEATRHFNSAEFKRQMADIQKQIESGAMQRSMEEASRQMKFAEQRQAAIQKLDMAKMQQQIDAATAKINSPEFKQRMADIQKQIESGAMQRSMEEASKQMKFAEQRQAAIQNLDMAKMQQQIDAATAKINSPEFKQRMENLQKQIESGAMQRSMEEASKQLKAAEDRMRQEQTK